MGCISSSPAGADKAEGNSKRKTLGGGNLAEASTKVLGANCQAGHPLDKYDVLDTLGKRQPQDEYQGDVNFRTLHSLLKMVDERGFERCVACCLVQCVLLTRLCV